MTNIKTKVLEVQNYFIQKIIDNNFETIKVESSENGWIGFKLKIDDFDFNFSFNKQSRLCCQHSCENFISLNIKENALYDDFMTAVETFIDNKEEQIKAEKIEKLKSELELLETA